MVKEVKLVSWGYAIGGQWQSNQWTKYKLNTQGWRALWDRQGGKCAGCLGEFAHPLEARQAQGLKPEVDHRHVEGRSCETEDVRGLLCRSCNDFLGKIQDDRARLERLIAYLKQHGDYYG